MDYTEENSNRPSQLKPPGIRVPQYGSQYSSQYGLVEISDSQTNVRMKAPTKIVPPSAKHKLGAPLNEPDPKRKTLAQTAGEYNKPVEAAISSARPAVKGTSLVGAKSTHTRNPSLKSSISSSRPTSVSSRNTSNGSFSNSVGLNGRPKSSYGGGRSAFSQSTRTGTALARPVTSMEIHSSDDEPFLNNKRKAWDVGERMERMEGLFSDIQSKVTSTTLERSVFEEAIAMYKERIADLNALQSQLSSSNTNLQSNLEEMKLKVNSLQQSLLTANAQVDDQIRKHRIELDDEKRESRNEIDQMRRENTDAVDRLLREHREELREMERRATVDLEEQIREMERRNSATLEEERSRRLREVQDLESRIASKSLDLDLELKKKERDFQNMRGELEDIRGDLNREQTVNMNAQNEIISMREKLQKTGVESASTIHTLESTVASLRARIHFLESGSKAQSDSFVEMERRLQEALDSAEESKKKLIKEETLRRILFNQVQELKGNIRVMCRVRPVFSNGADEGSAAKITYPDLDKESKELEITGKEEKSSMGTITRKNHSFTFDRVFGPESQNQEVFEEISQLVQSALDGYNVCIFCYGQTGSGKTHTMSSADGMIPRATHQIYETATSLKDKGWEYTMEGSFVEVYNEEIHDLLGSSKDFDKKKHEIRHDDQKRQTTITGLRSVTLDSANAVESILKQADNNRSVAATKSNERSSRSHSVFILKLVGRNSTTNETSEGTLNLVDLAGSERLKQSGAEGDRMKETQNINKSLSCLGDVISALGSGKEGTHIPYRNSKLTYLLQYSLGGNSKTLMFVMASPLEVHLSETLTSLKFATKVHNTHIGTAKKSTKVRERSIDS
ncbi:unnamed protein product [Diplocarpon coronariae]